MACNKGVSNPTLFAQTMEYSLQKLQNSKTNFIDFESEATREQIIIEFLRV